MSIYESIYNLIHVHIYGGAALTSDMSLVLTLVSTIMCLFIVSVPFGVVWGVWRRLFR